MKKLLMAITVIAALALCSCTTKTVKVAFEPEIGGDGDIYIDIQCDGASVTTETDQTNTPDISPSLELEGLGEVL